MRVLRTESRYKFLGGRLFVGEIGPRVARLRILLNFFIKRLRDDASHEPGDVFGAVVNSPDQRCFAADLRRITARQYPLNIIMKRIAWMFSF